MTTPTPLTPDLLIRHLQGAEGRTLHPVPRLLLCGAQPHRPNRGDPARQGHHCGGHSDLPDTPPAGYVRHQDLCGDGRGRADPPPALRDGGAGPTLQSVVSQYLTTVKPMHEQYVEPSRQYADIVVLEGSPTWWPWT